MKAFNWLAYSFRGFVMVRNMAGQAGSQPAFGAVAESLHLLHKTETDRAWLGLLKPESLPPLIHLL